MLNPYIPPVDHFEYIHQYKIVENFHKFWDTVENVMNKNMLVSGVDSLFLSNIFMEEGVKTYILGK